MEEKRYTIYIGNEFLKEETGITDAPVSGSELVLTFNIDTFARITAGGPCICRQYQTGPDGISKCVKWSPPGCGDAPFKVRDAGDVIPATALEILDLSKKGFINLSGDITQEQIQAEINSAIGKLIPPSIPGTALNLKCSRCGKTGKENGTCILGGCLTIIPVKGGGKGSITWTF